MRALARRTRSLARVNVRDRHRGLRPFSAAMALAGALSACGAEVDTFTGALEGSDARIAFVVEGDRRLVYLCAGPTTHAFNAWADGPATATASLGRGALATADEGDAISGRYTAADARTFSFRALRGGAVFGALDEGCRAGLVEDPQRGPQGTWCSAAGEVAQVDPGRPLGDGRLVTVTTSGGVRSLELAPMRPSSVPGQ